MTTAVGGRSRAGRQAAEVPRPSEVYYVGREASVQFAGRPFNFRVGRVRPIERSVWTWLDGYELNPAGHAVARRSIFVMRTGLRPLVVIPQQRRRRTETKVPHG